MTSVSKAFGACFGAFVCLSPGLALAQEGVILDRDRQERAVQPPPMAAGTVQPAAAVTTAPAPSVPLTVVVIDGAAPTPAVLTAWRTYVGKTLDAATLRAVADKVAKAYGKTAALYTVNVPEQDFKGGVVRLRVIEGHFENVIIHGAVKDRDMSLIQAYAAKLAAETPLTRKTLERYISLIRDIPGLKPDIQLLQGSTPGGVKLAIGVAEKKFGWGIGVDNRGSPVLDQQELEGDVVWNSLLRQGDQTKLTAASSFDFNSAEAVSMTHSEPIGKEGMRLDLSAGYLQTRSDDFGLRGHASTLGLQFSYPVIRSYRDNLYLTSGLDGLDSDNAIFGETVTSEHTRSFRTSAIFSRSRPNSSLSLSATVSLGINGLGAEGNPLTTDADYTKAVFRAAYDRKLGKTVTLRLRGAAQIASDSWLPTSEMFALGGDTFGRGFSSDVLMGDRGTGGSVELGWEPPALPAVIAGTEFYTFADAGEVGLNYRALTGGGTDSLSSAGAGIRLAIKPGYVLGLEAAYPIDTPVTISRDWRYGFSVSSRF